VNREEIRQHIDQVIWDAIRLVAPELVEDTRAGTISANCIQPIINLFESAGWSPPMSEASAAAYAEGEHRRILFEQAASAVRPDPKDLPW
jgi:hypothetical protein